MEPDPLQLSKAIGEKLCREAIWDGDRATWLGDEKALVGDRWEVVHKSVDGDLYGGTAGIGLFLTRLWAATRVDELRVTAKGALGHALQWARRSRPGGSLYSGSAGAAAAIAEAAVLFEDDKLAAEARGLTDETLESLPERETDLIAGIAGSSVALLELGRLLGIVEATEAAMSLGRALVARAVGLPYPGASWTSDIGMNGPPLCGLGHGASGIAFALGELWLTGQDPTLLETSLRAAEYERAWFQREQINWPDLREIDRARLAAGEAPPFPLFWCHGALGIGMVRLRQCELTGQTILAAEAETAIQAAEKGLAAIVEGGGPADLSLCHGLAAYVELFVMAANVFKEPYFLTRAAECACLAAEFGGGGTGPWPSGVPDGGENPSLMLGLAGIGMVFLRVADPATAPVGLLYTSRVMPQRVIIQLSGQISPDDFQRLTTQLLNLVEGARIERISKRGRVLLRLPAGMLPSQAIAAVQGLESVEYAEPDGIDREADSSTRA